MKKSKIMVVAIAVAVVVIAAIVGVTVACSRPKTEFELSFEANNGSAVQSVKVSEGDLYTLPVPEKSGYEFAGWYFTSDFSGDPVEKFIVNGNTTFYAKWTQFFTVSLETNGGALPVNSFSLEAGEDLYEAMQSYTPEKSGLTFGGWFDGDVELTQGTLMPEANVTLTARYKVAYRVELYLQALEGDGYERAEDDFTTSDFVGATVSPNPPVTGFVGVTNPNEITSLVLRETASENVLRLYYNRRTYRITFEPDCPDGTQFDAETFEVRYGNSIKVPTSYTADGYYLYGWKSGSAQYKTNYVQAMLYNKEVEEIQPESFVPDGNMTFTAVWVKGYADMFGGQDYVFLDPDNEELCYLSRSGIYFAGEFNPDKQEFTFRDSKDEILLEGKMNRGSSFSYRNLQREGYTCTLYKTGSGLNEDVKIYFDAYNGITYSVKQEDGSTDDSKGTYLIDDDIYYTATFTEGSLAGQELVFTLGTVAGEPAFNLRNDEEANLGLLYRFGITQNGDIGVYGSGHVMLDGFGNAAFNTGSTSAPSWQSYYYTFDSDRNLLTMMNSQGSPVGTLSVMEFEGQKGYMFYSSELDHVFVAQSGATLTLDGLCNAVYQNGSDTVSGRYTTSTSVFGGYIVTVFGSEKNYTFLTSTGQTGGEGDEEAVTTYTFAEKLAGYAEYYYQDAEGTYYAPLIVINDSEEGKASLYGYTSSKTYEKVSSGTYRYDANTGKYLYTVEETFDAPNVSTERFDLPNIKSIVFALDSTTGSYKVNYWYTVTVNGAEGEATEDMPVSVYTCKNGEKQITITFVAGFVILSMEGEETLTGTYSTSNGITTISVAGSALYVELNDEDKTATVLTTKPYSCYELKADGTVGRDAAISYDGKGNATYAYIAEVDGESTTVSHVGKVEKSADEPYFGAPISVFKAEGVEFTFIELKTSSATYFARWNEAYNGYYDAEDGSQLILDGYGYQAEYYNGTDGTKTQGIYYIVDENVVCVILNNTYRYFDIQENKSFTLRGEEYGTYFLSDNQKIGELYFEFDGYGKLSVFTVADDATDKIYLDQNGTYVAEGETYKLTYTNGSESVTMSGKLSTMTISSGTYNVFILAHREIKRTYVNEKDWSVLVLDEFGNATKYTKDGREETGSYILISDTMLYYVNSDATDACIYRYNRELGTATPNTFKTKAYYSEKLDSMQFSPYGFAIFNGETRYYYDVEGDNAVIFRRAEEGDTNANEYGFVREDFGAFEDVKNWKGVTYYRQNGYAVTFERSEETKNEYPVLVTKENKQPLQKLVFTPTGGSSFSVSGQVFIEDKSYSCTVIRNGDEMYISIGYYRFDIEVSYGGEKEDGSSNSTYSVTRMRLINSMESYQYMYMYYMIYAFLGAGVANTFPNSYGVISIVTEYGTNGEKIEDYIEGQFGESSNFRDAQGNLIESIHASYQEESIGTTTIYTAEFTAADGYLYRLRFIPSTIRGLGTGYRVYALTRVETVQAAPYTVEVERIIASEYTSSAILSVTLKEGDNVIEATNIYLASENEFYYIVRTQNEDGKYTSAVYYTITMTVGEGSGTVEDQNILVPFAGATVTKQNVNTVYSDDGKFLADIDEIGVKLIALVSDDKISGAYVIKTCTYDAKTSTYTATTSYDKTFTVKVTDSVVEIAEVVTEEPETEESETETVA